MHFNKPGQNISLQISELAGQDESLFENAWMLMVYTHRININTPWFTGLFDYFSFKCKQIFGQSWNCFGIEIVQRFEIKGSLAVLCFYHIRQFHCEPLNLESLCEVSIACSVSILQNRGTEGSC